MRRSLTPRSTAALDDRELIARVRQLDPAALRAFFMRFHPLLMREARVFRVPFGLREELVTECLDDAAVALIRHTTPIPRSLPGHLLTAFRHDVLNARRNEGRRDVRNRTAVREGSAPHEWIIPETASEHALRSSEGPDDNERLLAPVLDRLASVLDEGLSSEERDLLTWVGQRIPQRTIAGWLGLSYGAVRTRVLRLRERLRQAAMRHAGQSSAEERIALQCFFRRTATPPSLRRTGPQRTSTADNQSPHSRAGSRGGARD